MPGGQDFWAGDMANTPMAERYQVVHCHAHGELVVVDHAGCTAGVLPPVDQDHRDMPGEAVIEQRVVSLGSRQDQTFHLARNNLVYHEAPAALVRTCIDDDRDIAVEGQHRLDSSQDGRKHWICEVGQYNADQARALRTQARGNAVGAETPCVGHLQDACHDVLRHKVPRGRIHHAGNGGVVDLDLGREVFKRDTLALGHGEGLSWRGVLPTARLSRQTAAPQAPAC